MISYEAVTRFQEFYKRKDLDMFTIAMSTPGLAGTELFHTAEKRGDAISAFQVSR